MDPNLSPEKTNNKTNKCTSTATCSHWVNRSISWKTKNGKRQIRHEEMPRRKPIIKIAERPFLQPHEIVAQPEVKSKEPVVQIPVSPEKSVKNIEYVDPSTKPTVKPTGTE